MSQSSETREVLFLHTAIIFHLLVCVSVSLLAETGLVRASVWTSIAAKRAVTLSATRSGLTCSFSPLVVVGAGDSGGRGLLLPVQSLWFPVARQGPLVLLARWKVRLTSFRELHTETPLSDATSERLVTQKKNRHISFYFSLPLHHLRLHLLLSISRSAGMQ